MMFLQGERSAVSFQPNMISLTADSPNSKDADQIQAIAFLDVTVSLLDFEVGSERSFTEPSGPFRINGLQQYLDQRN
jgi:hypothetical protein